MEVLIESMVRPDQFDKLPKLPRIKKHGKEVFLVSKKEGLVVDVNIGPLRKLESCVRIDLNIQPGMRLLKTTNAFTRPGSIQLVSASGNGHLSIFMYITCNFYYSFSFTLSLCIFIYLQHLASKRTMPLFVITRPESRSLLTTVM
jgi:hypothetical protein